MKLLYHIVLDHFKLLFNCHRKKDEAIHCLRVKDCFTIARSDMSFTWRQTAFRLLNVYFDKIALRHLSVAFLSLLLYNFTVAQIYQEHMIPSLTPVGHSATAWADYNNDGYLDFIITGQKSNGDYTTELFRNNRDGPDRYPTFTLYYSFTPVVHGSIVWGDINHDTYLDFHLTGKTSSGQSISELYINQGDETFLLHPAPLEGVSHSAATFTDFDHDGDLDLAYTGVNNQRKSVLKFYKNQDNTFHEVVTSLPGFSHGSLEASDYNHDGYSDLLITGLLDDGSKASHIYRNPGDFTFTKINTTLASIAFGNASWGDYNHDGYPDILLSGVGEGGIPVSKVYKNNKNEVFTEILVSLDPLSNSSAVWLDYNNDGALDIFLSGLKGSNAENMLYENNGHDSFSLVSNTGILKVYDGDISITDHDRDGNQDLLITGFNNMGVQSKLYTNTLANLNITPAIPAEPHVMAQEDSVVLNWQPASDTETATEGLSYEIYIGTSPQETDIIVPSSFISDGQRKILRVGSQSYVTTYTVKNLPEGRYYWAVQAIDASLKGSSFSSLDSFDICYPIFLGADRNVCSGETVPFALEEKFDQVSWHSAKGISVENRNIISFPFYEKDTIWVVAKNHLGCLLRDTVIVNVEPLPVVSLGKDTTVCYQETCTLAVEGSPDNINWYSKQHGLLASDTLQISYQAFSPDTLWVEAFNRHGCFSYDTIVIHMHNPLRIEAGEDRSICLGNTTILGSEHNRENDFQYQWKPTYALDNPYSPSPVASPDTTTTYLLQVVSPYGCTVFDSVTVAIHTPPALEIIQDTVICTGESVMLGKDSVALGSLYLSSYEWFPKGSLDNAFIPNPVATPDTTTTYTLVVQNGNCSTDTAQVTVHVSELPDVRVSLDITIGFGETVQLAAEGSMQQYEWFPIDGLSRTDVPDPFASPKTTTTYVVTGYNQHGCSHQDSVTIYVDNRVFIPNLFSPNQDGQNDTFKVYGSGIETLALQVYDASGKQVYNSTNVREIMEAGWDGTFHSAPLPSGHYLWTIHGQFYDGKPVAFEGKTSGKIRLIR